VHSCEVSLFESVNQAIGMRYQLELPRFATKYRS
jgi:hypothetical protein